MMGATAKRRDNRIKKAERRLQGSLTVFLALSIPVILSLIFVLLDGARRNAIRMQTELAADAAVNAALAEFSRELFLQYDLLMIDTSYGTGTPSVSNTERHIRHYMEENLSQKNSECFEKADLLTTSLSGLEMTDTRLATDDDGRALREQVQAYLSAEPFGELASGILSAANGYHGFGFDLTEWDRRKSENEEELQRGLEEARNRRKQKQEMRADGTLEETQEDQEEEEKAAGARAVATESGVDEEHAGNPWKEVNEMRRTPILTAVLEGKEISHESVEPDRYLSHRSFQKGNGQEAENSHHYREADALFMNVYINEKCGNYQKPLDKSRLKYQMEYLLYGKGADQENLEKAAQTLLLIRLAANTAYLFSDGAKKGEAKLWGGILSLICFCPELEEAFTTALLLAWSYSESMQDLRTLFSGGKVPLMKNSGTWKTGLLSIFSPGLAGGGAGEGSGLDYTEYLRVLLFLENRNMRDFRLMDLMEMDVRKAEKTESFRMDGCLDTFFIEAKVTGKAGYECSIQREGSYG